MFGIYKSIFPQHIQDYTGFLVGRPTTFWPRNAFLCKAAWHIKLMKTVSASKPACIPADTNLYGRYCLVYMVTAALEDCPESLVRMSVESGFEPGRRIGLREHHNHLHLWISFVYRRCRTVSVVIVITHRSSSSPSSSL